MNSNSRQVKKTKRSPGPVRTWAIAFLYAMSQFMKRLWLGVVASTDDSLT
ncbi:hypothetical protein H6G89_14670 [Oscillatoria sp. FACHB-1407]|nr:hypothetical protein [Oscillatoria sp. FACHB-1407]MBD2462289.1 hypothetical protein [Oscillatoria sp. FACHB-1407]